MSFYQRNKAKQTKYFSSAKIGGFIENKPIIPAPEIITKVDEQPFEELLDKKKKKKRLPGEKLLKKLTRTSEEHDEEKRDNKMKRIRQAIRKDIEYM